MGTTQYRVIHDQNAQTHLYEWLKGLYQKSVAQAALIKEACEILATKRVSGAEAVEVLNRVYPDPRAIRNTAPKEVLVKRAEHREYIRQHRVVAREQVLNLFDGKGTYVEQTSFVHSQWQDSIAFLGEVKNIYENVDKTSFLLALQLKSIMVSNNPAVLNSKG